MLLPLYVDFLDVLDDVFFVDVFFLGVDLPFPSFKKLAIPTACPLATLSKNLLLFNLLASALRSIKRFSGRIAGILVSRSTAKLADFLPRLVTAISFTA